MDSWIPYTIAALVLWGLWSFLPKLSAQYISPKSGLVFQTIGVMIITLAVLISIKFKPDVHRLGIVYAILTGIIGGLAVLSFWMAISRGKVATVIPITALYPAISVLLAIIILQEPITLKQGLGIVLACISVILLTL